MKFTYLLISLTVWVVACTGTGPGSALFRPNTPHEEYERSLKSARLDQTALGIDWTNAAQRALRDSLRITVPYRESGYFSASKPLAVGYRINGSRGDKFTIRVEVQGRQAGRVFIDVFALDGSSTNLVAFANADADSTAAAELVWEPRRTQPHLIRIQPELLRSGRYTLSITRDPVLSFPVQGRTSKQIASYYGAPRDGGRRRHEGIDIFAPKGTPALAGVNGVISQVGENNLGGKVVFLTDNERQQRLYYAHLDRFNVTDGQRVSVGDTIGFVGNTGNARTTPPHLHFGIYSGYGAVNPLPFVYRTQKITSSDFPRKFNSPSVKITTAKATLRQAPESGSPTMGYLAKNEVVTLLGENKNWLHIQTAASQKAFVHKSLVRGI